MRRESSSERRALREVREPGPLAVSPEVAAALARLLAIESKMDAMAGEPPRAVDAAPALSLEAVDTLEDFLRARLADDALAVFAARSKTLSLFELAQVGSRSERAWEMGLGKGRIVLGIYGKHLVCVPRRPDAGFALRVTLFDPEDSTESDGGTLGSWLERVVDGCMGELLSGGRGDGGEDDDLDLDLDVDLGAIEGPSDWTPHLERTLVLPDPVRGAQGRRVRHPRFGVGTVIKASPESDKLEIDFGAEHGVRVLLARYVEEIAE